MKTEIQGYENFPGEHCGSSAMRGLLNHYCGLRLPEPAVFGLGSSLDCVYIASEESDPPRMVFGRALSLETELAANLQIDYREEPVADDDEAWRLVRDEVLAGRPTMLSGDIFYLDYRDYTVHFPGHRFVLVGFNEEAGTAQIADRMRVEAEVCSLRSIRESRNPPNAMTTNNLWGKFHGTDVGRTLLDATRLSIARNCERMLSPAESAGAVPMRTGLAALRGVAEEIGDWGTREDAAWIASYNARAIEKFGNGGGNFRRLQAGFLRWAHELDAGLVEPRAPGLATEAADGWTALADILFGLSEDATDAQGWRNAAVQARAVAEIETRLFELLAA